MYRESDQKLRDIFKRNQKKNSTPTHTDDNGLENVVIAEALHQSSHTIWECLVCAVQYKTERSLLKHQRNCERPIAMEGTDSHHDSDGPFQPEDDEALLPKRLAKESTSAAQDQNDCKLQKIMGATNEWICEKCGETMQSKQALKEHRKAHREPKKYTENSETAEFTCDECGKSFKSKDKVQMHVRRHGDIKCLCNMCGKWLSCLGNLRKHYKAVHLNQKNLACPICDHRFTSSFRLKDHVNSHNGIRAYSCTLCETRFFNYSAVKRHMDTVHSDEKKYVCNVCSKAFKIQNNLKTHMFAHTGIYEHTCEHCGTGFRRKNKMMQHIQEAHGIET